MCAAEKTRTSKDKIHNDLNVARIPFRHSRIASSILHLNFHEKGKALVKQNSDCGIVWLAKLVFYAIIPRFLANVFC